MYRQKECRVVLLALPEGPCDGGVLVQSTQLLLFTLVPGANQHLVSVIQLVIAFYQVVCIYLLLGVPCMGPGGGEGDVVSCLSTSRWGGLKREIL